MEKAIKYLDKLADEHGEKGKSLYDTNPSNSLDNYVIESQLRFASTKLSEANQTNEKSVLHLDVVSKWLPILDLTYKATGGDKFLVKNKFDCICTARIVNDKIEPDEDDFDYITHYKLIAIC